MKATISHILAEFMHMFMAEGVEKGRQESAMSWDKEGPRVLTKDYKNTKRGSSLRVLTWRTL